MDKEEMINLFMPTITRCERCGISAMEMQGSATISFGDGTSRTTCMICPDIAQKLYDDRLKKEQRKKNA